ncbi:hypothetical protein FOA52_014554 [Chlamydomonas sp. UWO 241]|nr:hypothetical protein FOA52_014554 [Chlamydomonas sp. UWO 241]
MLESANTPPPRTKNVAMAYQAQSSAPKPAPSTPSRSAWEDLRREARRLEGDVDVKLSAFNKLCSGFEASSGRGGDGTSSSEGLASSKAAELESLLGRLSDINDQMGSLLGGVHDSRAHLLARHRDILQENSHEFRRLLSSLGAARDRVALMAGVSSSSSAHVSLNVGSTTGALLRERATVTSSTHAIDEVLSTAQGVSSNLMEQRGLLDTIGQKVVSVGVRFPVVNSLLNAIRRKKSKDTMVLAGVIAACFLFTLMYLAFK